MSWFVYLFVHTYPDLATRGHGFNRAELLVANGKILPVPTDLPAG